MARLRRETVKNFAVTYDDETNSLHLQVTTRLEVRDGRGLNYTQSRTLSIQNDVLVLTPAEWARLMGEGMSALNHQIETVRKNGVRVNYATDELIDNSQDNDNE